MALSLTKMCTKVGLSGGAIYWSIQQGVWGTTQEGSEAMQRFTATILPEQTKRSQPVLKPDEGIFLSSWNQGTKIAFEYIRDVPEYAGKVKSSAMKLVEGTFGK